MFTLKDLKDGDVIKTRDGFTGIIFKEKAIGDKLCCTVNNENYNTDLTSTICSELDIIKVARGCNVISDIDHLNANSYIRGKLVFNSLNRDTVEEMTLEEVCDALGKEIKIVKKH